MLDPFLMQKVTLCVSIRIIALVIFLISLSLFLWILICVDLDENSKSIGRASFIIGVITLLIIIFTPTKSSLLYHQIVELKQSNNPNVEKEITELKETFSNVFHDE